ncbi:copper transporter [Cellulomonas fengjieae]|uniref:Copper transporter n=1 Tax=Cellulomonas fengjieae TaxID=2819978 RepID=A0ABS3SJJ0_9CELL|nr:copper transporter [Cellulomonas fengjieae]MBO3085923.1 copper transporter [Cellulomonas fengjieae]MBO3103032.1 copper transporter [Cellulomonas fengjieae]QVI67384.1 copper transporter [Cellulomonas fengjieae]
MIDFRYHIVSLISVFLALAVGIALGAGPLKETIGDTLTGQVEQLRTEKDTLRAELDTTSGDLQDTETYIDAAGPQLLDGTLTDRRVAVVALGEVDESIRTAIDDRLAQAGASVTARVTLTETWVDPDARTFRQALVGQLLTYLDPVPSDDAGVEEELASALVQALVTSDPANPDVLSDDASVLLELLSSSESDSPLVAVAEEVTMPADAVVVIAVPFEEQVDGATPSPDPSESVQAAQLAVLSAAQTLSSGAVLADGARGDGSLTDAVLADPELAATLATVSGVDLVTGQINVPLALADRIAGTTGHYGFGEGETPLPAPVELAPVDRTPRVPENADADAVTGTEG